jgi:enoyl-CoA hydratase/carnithine racemase
MQTGLINHCYPAGRFRESIEIFIRRFQSLSSFSLRHAKRAIRRVMFDDFDESLATAESIYLHELMAGHDPTEGLAAFMEKRKPSWLGR